MRNSTPAGEHLTLALSEPRMTTYISSCNGDPRLAAALYQWNATVSAAFMLPVHFVEVVLRNAVAEAIENTYGPHWPWDEAFVRSLNNRGRGSYTPQQELRRARQNKGVTSKVVPELKFAFWVDMFTSRHDERLWVNHLHAVLPHHADEPVRQLRGHIRQELDAMRKLRNRLAHHEPIFTRDLGEHLQRMFTLIDLRSAEIGRWVRATETVSQLLPHNPLKLSRA